MPKHPYTEGLIDSIPQISDTREALATIEGTVPNPTEKLTGCSFWPRCGKVMDVCKEADPEVISQEEGRRVRCWLYEEQAKAETESSAGEGAE